MALTKERKAELIRQFGGSPTNTGSIEAQVAMLTERINDISEHLEVHPKDHNTARNLMRLVGRRKRLLRYLQQNNLTAYRQLIEKLNLRK
ncbi:MAG: 30S ribosomal protein S15 [Chitinophagales bacterium]|nr:30S ribosomal protein S15 [Chitinophagales bacterium]MDW8428348.1 30S ribosomal protein S15 [Chitinophagales bacterium]